MPLLTLKQLTPIFFSSINFDYLYVKGLACSCGSRENYHPTAVVLNSAELFSIFQLIVLGLQSITWLFWFTLAALMISWYFLAGSCFQQRKICPSGAGGNQKQSWKVSEYYYYSPGVQKHKSKLMLMLLVAPCLLDVLTGNCMSPYQFRKWKCFLQLVSAAPKWLKNNLIQP